VQGLIGQALPGHVVGVLRVEVCVLDLEPEARSVLRILRA
jgi:hypothetical protein